VSRRLSLRIGRSPAVPAVLGGALLLRLLAGVGFANYDTLYALAWGGQLARGSSPAYETAIAPTPHPLVEALGFVLSPMTAGTIEDVTVALGFLALSACAWVIYALAREWFGVAAGALAALIFITRDPVLSYGVRAYIDIPYLFGVLCALLLIARRPRAAAKPLALLSLAGLLRPEAWVFSGLYLLYVLDWLPARRRRERAAAAPAGRERAGLILLAASAPAIWLLSDLAITGDLLWSLKNTRHTAHALDRVRGISNVPQYIPRRVGEILRPPVLAGATVGIALGLRWLRARALAPAAAGVLALVVFAAFATLGLPINTRYAFGVAAIGCVFAGAGAFGWRELERDDPRRLPWMVAGAIVVAALLAYAPASYKGADRELGKLARQERIQNDLVALVGDHAVTLRCGPVGVPNHAPVPLLALYLKTSPREITNAATGEPQQRGVYVDPASKEVEADYVLDPKDPVAVASIPPGFSEVRANRSWLIFRRCGE
jgi:hypothetical protein